MEPGVPRSGRGFLHVVVYGARALRAADFHMLRKSSSDPYCVVKVGESSMRTRTIREDLNPRWEQAFSFQIGNYLSWPVLILLGEFGAAAQCHQRMPRLLSVSVMDEDQWTKDDPLGCCDVSLAEVFGNPGKWIASDVALQQSAKRKDNCGNVSISLFWQPVFLARYTRSIIATSGFAVAFALLGIGSFCRWQPGGHGQPLHEPGVQAACVLAALLSLLATIVQFMVAHMTSGVELDKLAGTNGAALGLSTALGGTQASSNVTEPGNAALLVKLKPAKLTSYDVSVFPNTDFLQQLHLPVIIVARLVPIGVMALVALALALQAFGSSLFLQPGELCAFASLGSCACGVLASLSSHEAPYAAELKRQLSEHEYRGER